MRDFLHKVKTNKPLRKGAGIALITLGVIGSIAPIMPGVVFIVLGGSLLEIEHRAFKMFTDFAKSENKTSQIIQLYKNFYSIKLPEYIKSIQDKRAGKEPVLTKKNIFIMTSIAIGLSIFMVSGILLTKSYYGLHLESSVAQILGISESSAINLISAAGVLPLMFIILAIVKKRQRTIILFVIMIYIASLVLSVF